MKPEPVLPIIEVDHIKPWLHICLSTPLIAGLDIGSRSIELVVVSSSQMIYQARLPTTFDPLSQCRRLLAKLPAYPLVATGYGRNLVAEYLAQAEPNRPVTVITEIKAYANGVHTIFPQARTVLDIGGQDTKVIALAPNGRVLHFEMNDRCAAGTGKFLEFMANIFQVLVENFGHLALTGSTRLAIGNMCTVFAETEAMSLMAQGHRQEDIALGLHAAIVKRTLGMLGRVGLTLPLVFAGGVAHNPCVVTLLREALDEPPLLPETPDYVGALGAAIWGEKQFGVKDITI
ncbi:(R)-2-hydroxyacyl-CoA dehydratese activating ATPase [Desulfovibrionales bacterium]